VVVVGALNDNIYRENKTMHFLPLTNIHDPGILLTGTHEVHSLKDGESETGIRDMSPQKRRRPIGIQQ
jgi:hypothetical protein